MGATHWPGTIAVFGTWLFASGFTGCFLTKFANLDFITAADHNWVVTLTNYGGDIIPIHGNTQPRTTLNLTQISCGQQFRGDPQVRVDNANRWWFAVVTSLNLFGDPSGECLSVSIGTDPRGPYYEYFYPGAVDGLWLGVSSTKVTLTGPFADGKYKTIVINRSDAVSGVTPRTATLVHSGGGWFRPAQNVSTLWPGTSFLYGPSPAGAYRARIHAVTGVPGVDATSARPGGIVDAWADTPITYSLLNTPGPVAQPDGSFVALPGLTSAVVNDGMSTGSMWIAHADPMSLYVTEFVDLPPFAPRVRQTASLVAPPGSGFGCPSIAADNDNDVVVGFAAASPSEWLSSYLTWRRSYDRRSLLRAPSLVASGSWAGWSPGHVWRVADYCAGAEGLDGVAWHVQPVALAGDAALGTSVFTVGFDPHSLP